jgi:hypothetical protein
MPRPESEREAWEVELKELTALLATHQRELEATPEENTERREALQWIIKRAEMRMADLRARLARPADPAAAADDA